MIRNSPRRFQIHHSSFTHVWQVLLTARCPCSPTRWLLWWALADFFYLNLKRLTSVCLWQENPNSRMFIVLKFNCKIGKVPFQLCCAFFVSFSSMPNYETFRIVRFKIARIWHKIWAKYWKIKSNQLGKQVPLLNIWLCIFIFKKILRFRLRLRVCWQHWP